MSNKRIFLTIPIAALALTAVSSSVRAQTFQGGQNLDGSAGGEFQISGAAPAACVLRAPEVETINNAVFISGETSAEIQITQLVDPITAEPLPANIDMAFPIVCNGAHRVTVRTEQGALVLAIPAPPPGPGLTDRLPYQVSGIWAGQVVTGSSETLIPVDIATPDGAAGMFALSIQILGGAMPLVAGPYTDSIVVELQPAS